MTHPIPNAALDDRLGFVGTSGSGKTYAAGTAVERLLQSGARVVVVDPLGVWWGLRLRADGKAAAFDVAIFGGPHGDLPLTQHAGELIGETAATMAESCIIDLSELGNKSAERRFMTGFLDAIYRKATGQPFHLVVDEADLFAPQKPPKGDETLLNLTEQIVRRGRVKGFIPWLITQRPAVINKNVLSQVDGLIALKLTSSQDRDALDAWIEGQADKADARAIKDGLPALPVGTAVVWLPGRGILDTKGFPAKDTFDSSRTPKRGEKPAKHAALKPLDLGALQERLAKVEAEKKADDPKALRAEIAKLKADVVRLSNKSLPAEVAAVVIEDAEKRGFERGKKAVGDACQAAAVKAIGAALEAVRKALAPAIAEIDAAIKLAKKDMAAVDVAYTPDHPRGPPARSTPARAPQWPVSALQRPAKSIAVAEAGGDGFTRPQMRVLESLAMWRALGHEAPSREMVAAIAGYSPSSGGFNNLLGQIKTAGAIDYPQAGLVSLLAEGVGVPSVENGRSLLVSKLTNPQRRIIAALVDQGERTREELGADTEYSPSSGGFNNLLGQLRTLGLIDYPRPGSVIMSEWAQELLSGWRAAA